MDCGFYELQRRLRDLGWYVEWEYASQESHIWEDMPEDHEAGPFVGQEIDKSKVLFSFTGDSDAYKVPEGMSSDDVFDWHQIVLSYLSDEDAVGLEKYLEEYGHPELPLPNPEGWGGNEFLCPWEEMIDELIIPIADQCGCRVIRSQMGDRCWIEWGDPDASDRFYPQNKDTEYYQKRDFAKGSKSGKPITINADSPEAVAASSITEEIEPIYRFIRWSRDGQEDIHSRALGRTFPAEITENKICDVVSDEELMIMAKGREAPELWQLSNYQNPRAARAITHLAKRLCLRRKRNDRWYGARGDYEDNIAKNPVTTSAALKILVENPFGTAFEEKFLDIMSHPNCNLTVWKAFAESDNWGLRQLAAEHPACPKRILKLLSEDTEPAVRSAAESRLAQ